MYYCQLRNVKFALDHLTAWQRFLCFSSGLHCLICVLLSGTNFFKTSFCSININSQQFRNSYTKELHCTGSQLRTSRHSSQAHEKSSETCTLHSVFLNCELSCLSVAHLLSCGACPVHVSDSNCMSSYVCSYWKRPAVSVVTQDSCRSSAGAWWSCSSSSICHPTRIFSLADMIDSS